MSAIPPPNWLGSVAQASGAQQRAAIDRDKTAPGASTASPFAQNLIDEIGTSDSDTKTDADSEGQGSQGRQTADPQDTEDRGGAAEAADTSVPGRLDLQA